MLRAFQETSGLEINTTKTEGMWLGSCRHNAATPFDIIWPSEPIYALGIYFSYDEVTAFNKNFEQKLISMKNESAFKLNGFSLGKRSEIKRKS